MRTNLNPCSRAGLALLALLVLAVAATPAAAVSVGDEDVPEAATAGAKVEATVTLDELYKDPSLEQWALAGETELTDVTWTVTYYDQTGSKVGQKSYDGQSFGGAQIAASEDVSEVAVRVTGTAPGVAAYTYDPAPTFTVLNLTQTREGGSSNDVASRTARHYTDESMAAREAIESAESAIAASGGADTGEAETTLANAVDAYEGGEFELATTLADEAASKAAKAEKSKQTVQYAMYGVGGLVVLGVVVGGVVWWRSQQDSYDRLG